MRRLLRPALLLAGACLGLAGVPGVARGDVPSELFESGSDLSAANTTARRFFLGSLLPRAHTEAREAEQEARRETGLLSSFLADFAYERADFESVADGGVNVFTATAAGDWKGDRFGVGLMIPYDHLDLGGREMDRVGALLSGSYHRDLTHELALNLSANFNYLHTFLSPPLDDADTYGAGLGAALVLTRGDWVPSAAVAYSYAVDNNDLLVNDQSHLIKVGFNLGHRFLQRAVANLFLIGNFDASRYRLLDVDTTYMEVGLGARWSVSDCWSLDLGYKKVLALRDYQADRVYLGSALLF